MRTYLSNKKNIFFIILSILISLISALSVSSILLTNGSLQRFNNTGATCDITEDSLLSNNSNLTLDSNNKINILDKTLPIYIQTNHSDYNWNYFECKIDGISDSSTNCLISYYNKDDILLSTSSIALQNGHNIISIPVCSFSKIAIKAFSGHELSFSISNIHLRKQYPLYTANNFVAYFLILSILFIIICIVFFHLYNKYCFWHNHNLLSKLLRGYQACYHRLSIHKPASQKLLSTMQILILCTLFLFLNYANLNSLFFDKNNHRFIMLILCFLIIILSLFSIPKSDPAKVVIWKNPLVNCYFIFWIMTCISDFIVSKYLPFYGYIMISIMGFLFYIWSKSNTEDTMHILCSSIEIIYLLNIVYCFLFQPYTGYRYVGAYNNPNPYAFFLTICGIAIACQLEYYLKHKSIRKRTLFRYTIELCLLLFFLFLTQSVTSFFALTIAGLFWIIRNFKYITSYYHHRLLHILFAFVICMPVITVCANWIVRNTPIQLAASNDFMTQYVSMPFHFGTTVNAATNDPALSSTRIFDKLFSSNSISTLLTGRNYYYMGYLRNMNLFGHYYRPTMYGLGNAAGSYAHNGFLSVAYTYGVYTVIPYFFMLFYYGKYAFRYYKNNQNSRYAFFPLGIFIVFFIENLSDNVDTPFHWIVWFIFTFTMGLLFQNPEQKPTQNTPDSH